MSFERLGVSIKLSMLLEERLSNFERISIIEALGFGDLDGLADRLDFALENVSDFGLEVMEEFLRIGDLTL